eukprot:6294311-Amphidinium_carterae.1
MLLNEHPNLALWSRPTVVSTLAEKTEKHGHRRLHVDGCTIEQQNPWDVSLIVTVPAQWFSEATTDNSGCLASRGPGSPSVCDSHDEWSEIRCWSPIYVHIYVDSGVSWHPEADRRARVWRYCYGIQKQSRPRGCEFSTKEALLRACVDVLRRHCHHGLTTRTMQRPYAKGPRPLTCTLDGEVHNIWRTR